MKKFVRITSEKNIEVTPGLQAIDMTNKDAHVADRFRVASAWVQTRVLIRVGTGFYPAQIKNWDAVKSLARDKILTVGEETDECDDPTAEETLARLEREQKRYKAIAEAAAADAIAGGTTAVESKVGKVYDK